MSLVLFTLAFVIRLALGRQAALEKEAFELLGRGPRYEEGLRPVDLIHIGEFIQEWIPPKQ